MQQYEVKRQLKSAMSPERIRELLQLEFGSVAEQDGHYVVSYGALSKLECWLTEKKKLCIETESRKDANDSEAAETITKYNRFLFNATGYSSKERRKKAMKTEQD